MSKYRIYELAKEFNTTSKVVLDILARNNNTAAKNHMSTVGEDEKSLITKTFAQKNNNSEPEKKVVPPRNFRPQQGANDNMRDRRDHNARPNQPHPQSRPHTQNQPQQQRPDQQHSGQRPPQNHSQPSQLQRQDQQRGQRPPQNQGQQQNAGRRPTTNTTTATTTANNNRNQTSPQNRPQTQNNNNNRGNFSTPNQGNNQNNNNRNRAPFGQGNQNNRNNSARNRNQKRPNTNNRTARPLMKVEVEKPKKILLGETITVKDFASKSGREVGEIIKKLMMLGIMATINQEIDFDTASLLAADFELEVEELPPEVDPTEIPEIVDDPKSLQSRPPVVTVMGHVDHGKTSLLDVIRKSHVTAKEAGGITQHIGAYQVICQNKKIVFLDTPGHEAFTAMRARGAQVTDIAILVVAADDGVMPQTIEAINHAKSANVPIIVAINKIDRPGSNPDHVKQQLSEHGLIPEDWGGETIMVPVSARQSLGITELLEMVLLVAEMQELKANPNRAAQGVIIEAKLDKGRGTVATVLVQTGTLKVGDSILAGTAYGKVRAMNNDRGERVKKAGPSMPVEVLGLADVPEAGDVLAALEEKQARAIAEKRIAKKRSDDMKHSQKISLDDLFQQIQEGNIKDLNILIKADVQGSVEALRQSLLNLNAKNEEVRVNIIHAGAGAVNESDVMLASAANALIIAFNVRPDANARKLADTESIDIRTYRVIYEAIGDVEAAMTGMLAPQYKEVIQGKVEIRQVMNFSKALVAGSYVLEGKITNSSNIRIIRDSVVVYEGMIESLRRFKDDVKEVAAGYECGITLDKFRDFKEADIIEAYTMEQIKPGEQ